MRTSNENWIAALTARDRRNLRPITIVALLWALSAVTVGLFFPRGDGTMAQQPLWGWPIAIFAIANGGLLAYFYLRFVRGLDEMWRRVHTEAMAVAFGVAFVWGLAAYLLDQLGVPKVQELTWAVMLIAYAVRRALGVRTVIGGSEDGQ